MKDRDEPQVRLENALCSAGHEAVRGVGKELGRQSECSATTVPSRTSMRAGGQLGVTRPSTADLTDPIGDSGNGRTRTKAAATYSTAVSFESGHAMTQAW